MMDIDYTAHWAERQRRLLAMRENPALVAGAKEHYRDRPKEFIVDWAITYDPRKKGDEAKSMPFVLFERQELLVDFTIGLLKSGTHGLVEKSRDMGATYVMCGIAVWMWLFQDGATVGFGSNKEVKVDRKGDPGCIFEKLRQIIRDLPHEFLPDGFNEREHMSFMRIVHPETEASIIGETGDNIGRGGRTSLFILDEAAHIERPHLVEAALNDNTDVRVDVSTPFGLGNVFHRKREQGKVWEGGEMVADRTNVFPMLWYHHPDKTQEWYDNRKAKAEAEGDLAGFAQEVDCDYSASVEGRIIDMIWIHAAIDAHEKLGFNDDGLWVAGLDVSGTETGDRNALVQRKGSVLKKAHEWGGGDTSETARKAVDLLESPHMSFQYDSVGVGAGVKAEFNRLRQERRIAGSISFSPWNAGASVLDPDAPFIPNDTEAASNKDKYANLKAQAWYSLRERFYRTWRAVEKGDSHDPAQMISLSSDIPILEQLTKELAQATGSIGGNMKMIVDKTPEGTRSPDLADACVMAFFPVMERKARKQVRPTMISRNLHVPRR